MSRKKCNCHYQCGCNKGECNCHSLKKKTFEEKLRKIIAIELVKYDKRYTVASLSILSSKIESQIKHLAYEVAVEAVDELYREREIKTETFTARHPVYDKALKDIKQQLAKAFGVKL